MEDDLVVVVYNGTWYLAGNGHLIATTRFSNAKALRRVDVDEITWRRLIKAYTVIPEPK
jgi:hypothetical protein